MDQRFIPLRIISISIFRILFTGGESLKRAHFLDENHIDDGTVQSTGGFRHIIQIIGFSHFSLPSHTQKMAKKERFVT